MATTKGIDVSVYQKNVDYAKLKGKADFVIIRAGFGNALAYPNQVDSQFENNYKGCKDYSIPCGVYWYSYAKSVKDAVNEAKSCLATIKGKKFEYPIFIDVEESSQFALGKEIVSDIVAAFCDTLESAGYFAGLYISRSPLQNYITPATAKKYTLWIADYGDKCHYNDEYGIWQYSGSGKIDGVSTDVDLNFCYVDYPTIIKSKGLNGYKKPSPAHEILDEGGLRYGDKGDGVLAYKCMLLAAKKKGIITQSVDKNNSFGNGTQMATNQLLGNWSCEQNGIAGKNLIIRLHELLDKL